MLHILCQAVGWGSVLFLPSCGIPTLSKGEWQMGNWPSLGAITQLVEHPCPQDALRELASSIPLSNRSPGVPCRWEAPPGSFGRGWRSRCCRTVRASALSARKRSLRTRLAHPAVSGKFFQTFSLHFCFLNLILNVLCLSPWGSK